MPDGGATVTDASGDAALLPPLIPDLSVLLSPWGAWLTQRLSQVTAVWLPRSLVMLLEGDGLPCDPAIAAELAPVIAFWNRCWPEFVQRRRVHWFSDALDMSHAPKGEPPALLDRFDALVAALDRKLPPELIDSMQQRDRLYLEGTRDALALAATLQDEQSVLLSVARHGETEPWACRALDRFGLLSHRLADEALRDVLAHRLLRGFAHAGLAPLLGAGVARLAALHLATPCCALPLPPPRPAIGIRFAGEPDEDALSSVFEEACDEGLWDGAVAVWYEVP
jgi:hypothetical protein